MSNISLTFGIITNITKPETFVFMNRLVDSIQAEVTNNKIENCEVIVVGNYNDYRCRCIEFPEDNNGTAYITRKQNLIIDNAKYENIVFLRDYHLLLPGWYKGLEYFGNDWYVLMNPILNKDNTRYRDLCHWDEPGSGLGWVQKEPWCLDGRRTEGSPYLPEYSKFNSKYCYINGGYFIAKKYFINEYRWNEELQWGQAEDVDLSLRMRRGINFRYKFNPYSLVKLQKQKDRTLPVEERFGTFEYCTEKYKEFHGIDLVESLKNW